jgi:hypothetical protein
MFKAKQKHEAAFVLFLTNDLEHPQSRQQVTKWLQVHYFCIMEANDNTKSCTKNGYSDETGLFVKKLLLPYQQNGIAFTVLPY